MHVYQELSSDWVNRATRVGPRQILVNLVDGIVTQGIWNDQIGRRSDCTFTPNAFANMSADWRATSDRSPLQVTSTSRFTYPEQAGETPRRSLRHMILLTADRDLIEGETLVLQPSQGGEPLTLKLDVQTKSDLVQVPHHGWTPASPDKHALIGAWFGPGSNSDAWLNDQLRFAVVHDATGEPVPGFAWTDQHRIIKTRSAQVVHAYDWRKENSWRTEHDIYEARFAQLTTPGRYRVIVQGLGSSYPFDIQPELHLPLVRHLARGFIHLQHDDEHRAAAVHPSLVIPPTLGHMRFIPVARTYASTNPDGIGDQGKLWSTLPIPAETDPQLIAFTVDHPTEGWRDAGDFDIRPQHMEVAINMMVMTLRFPWLAEVNLGRAEHGKAYDKVIRGKAVQGSAVIPDFMHMALYCGDAWTRMQIDTPGFWKGSVRGGFDLRGYIGMNRDFQSFATRFKPDDNMHLCRPDPWASYAYAGFAATAAISFDRLGDSAMKQFYIERALAAWNWAFQYENDARLPGWNPAWRSHRDFGSAKANAAVSLWALTGEKKYHDAYSSSKGYTNPRNAVSGQPTAARAYLIYDQIGYRKGDAQVLAAIRKEVLDNGYPGLLALVNTNPDQSPTGFSFARPMGPRGTGEYGMSLNNPYLSALEYLPLLLLTDDPQVTFTSEMRRNLHQWIDAEISYTAGRNPLGRSFITGFGHDMPRSLHHRDFAGTGLKYPFPGLIAFGLMSNRLTKENMGKADGYQPPPIEMPYPYRVVFGSDIHHGLGEFTPQHNLWPTLLAAICAHEIAR